MSEVKKQGEVRREIEGRIFKIEIDNVAKRNAFSPEMIRQLCEALTEFDERDESWVAVITARGEHFTAGLDMPKFFGDRAAPSQIKELIGDKIDPFGLGRRSIKPIITAVQGITYTLGIEMMLAGDIVIAADNARFCQLESKRGLAPLGGGHFRFLTRTGWGNAMYHLMLCDEFNAERALQIGLVQEVVPLGNQVARALEIADLINKNAPLGIRAMKEAALKYIEASDRAGIAAIPTMGERLFGTADAKEGLLSFIERREARFTGR